MRIDISSPNGNTVTALGLARKFLRESGFDDAYAKQMATDVFNAPTAAAARKVIEERTGGGITFFDSSARSEASP